MILISHRGNLIGKTNPKRENTPSYIEEAIAKGFHVEVDIWWHENNWWLGHDEPTDKVREDWLTTRAPHLFYHCKNIEAMFEIYGWDSDPEFFFHNIDDCTLTSKGKIWTYPGKPLGTCSIAVKPEGMHYAREELEFSLGICSDYIQSYKEYL